MIPKFREISFEGEPGGRRRNRQRFWVSGGRVENGFDTEGMP